MKLSSIAKIITEASLPLWEFNYPEFESDPNPKVVVLGTYIHPNTGKRLLMGVNARLLNSVQATQLLRLVNDLASIKSPRIRAKYLRTRAKNIFDSAYRTYDLSRVNGIEKTTITSKGPDKAKTVEPKPAPVKTADKPVIKKQLDKPVHPLETPNVYTTKPDKKEPVKTTKEPVKTTKEPVKTDKVERTDPLSQPVKTKVDNDKSTEKKNVETTGKVQKSPQLSQRRLDKMPERSEKEIRGEQNSIVSGLEDEKRRSI